VAAPTPTILGSSAADNLTTVQSSVVQAFAGNDTVTLTQGNDWGLGAAGNDSIRLTQTAGSVTSVVKGQDGNDTISLGTAASISTLAATLKGGKGTDLLQIGSAGTTIGVINATNFNGGSDADTILIGSNSGQFVNTVIKGGKGNDSIAIGSGATVNYSTTVIQGGSGADTIQWRGTDTTNTVRLSGGKGKDFLDIESGATIGSVQGGDGKDSILIHSAATVASIIGGGQKDTINLGTTFLGGAVFGDGGTSTTDGKDLIGNTTTLAAGATSIYGGGGDDTVEIGSASLNIVIDGGAGDDSITLLTGLTGANIVGGAGNDTIEFSLTGGGGASATVIDGGTDADLIYVGISTAAAQLGANSTVIGGDGADTVVLGGFVSGNSSIMGGSGADSISVAGSALAFGTITASSIINGGTGSDTISFGATSGTTMTTAVALTAVYASVVYEAGDVIHLISTAAAGNGANGLIQVGLQTGGFGTAIYGSGMTGIAAGDLGAYSDGTDTYFLFGVNAGSAVTLRVTGADLVLNTAADTTLAGTTANFGFVLGGTASTGLTITLA
jgi:Ca2+-binding RTX toxin-like protein